AMSKGKSLLPAGVTTVCGPFGRGDLVALLTPDGRPIGHGLTRYTSTEAELIKGRQSSEIEAILGAPGRAALIHRDDLALS
ncbi:MAG TPA: glutamate 5-kinase, partial [Sulfitobacter pontiacus]|nr:glutamate 5-kinase [Sulfitobacter pontiacus]